MTRFYVNDAGDYIGGFDGDDALTLVPGGAIEIPIAPADARQKWNGKGFEPLPDETAAREVTAADLAAALVGRGVIAVSDLPLEAQAHVSANLIVLSAAAEENAVR